MTLVIRDLSVKYGGIHALTAVDLQVGTGSLVALIGSNGAGKSTLLRTVSGLVPKASGTVLFNDRDVTHARANCITRSGLVHCPEGRHVFPRLTIDENLRVACHSRAKRQHLMEDVFSLFPLLFGLRHRRAQSLSGGEQQVLALGRSLMSDPQLLMLDEPSLGLAPIMIDTVFSAIKEIRSRSRSVLLVEQNASLALDVCDSAYVLEKGVITLSGAPEELAASDAVRRAYLGR